MNEELVLNEEKSIPVEVSDQLSRDMKQRASGKALIATIVVIDIIFGALGSFGAYAFMQFQQHMMTQNMASKYGIKASQISFAGGGSNFIGPILYFAFVALLAWFLYKGSHGARTIRIIFAGIAAIFQVFALLHGNIFIVISMSYACFVLWALCSSKSVKAFFANPVIAETVNPEV